MRTYPGTLGGVRAERDCVRAKIMSDAMRDGPGTWNSEWLQRTGDYRDAEDARQQALFGSWGDIIMAIQREDGK